MAVRTAGIHRNAEIKSLSPYVFIIECPLTATSSDHTIISLQHWVALSFTKTKV